MHKTNAKCQEEFLYANSFSFFLSFPFLPFTLLIDFLWKLQRNMEKIQIKLFLTTPLPIFSLSYFLHSAHDLFRDKLSLLFITNTTVGT